MSLRDKILRDNVPQNDKLRDICLCTVTGMAVPALLFVTICTLYYNISSGMGVEFLEIHYHRYECYGYEAPGKSIVIQI